MAATDFAQHTRLGTRFVETLRLMELKVALWADEEDHDFVVDYDLPQWWEPRTASWESRPSSERDLWKPAEWDEWGQERRGLWRRQQQLQRVIQLPPDPEVPTDTREQVIEHLQAEVEELSRRVGYVFPERWQDLRGRAVEDENARRRLEDELRSEVSEGHVLRGAHVIALAACQHCDDVLFKIATGFARVHLTYGNRPERPPWPRTDLFEAWAEVVHAVNEHEDT